jgi:hypothetical protein
MAAVLLSTTDQMFPYCGMIAAIYAESVLGLLTTCNPFLYGWSEKYGQYG